MTVLDFLRLTRRSWRALLAFTIVAAAAMVGYTAITPKVYQASSLGFIVSGDGGVISGSQDAVDRVTAYLPLISTTPVLQKVEADPAVDVGGQNLAGRLSASVVNGTTMIQISGTAPSPKSALALANGGLKALAGVITDVETAASPGEAPALKVVPLENAALPTVPISPNVRNNVALGAVGGLLLGFLFVFARRGLETRVRSKEEFIELIGAGLLGSIPKVSKGKLSIDTTDRDNVLAAEAFRQIRTALSFSSVDRHVQCIAITSANEQEGKTAIATRLAQVFARSGRPTLLIDADMRRPAVSAELDVDDTIGLSELLSGQADLGDVVQMTDEEDLFVIPAGQTPPNPSEMLGSDTFRTLLKELSADHFVIVDAPPVLPVTDASLIAAAVDGVVFVAVAGKTKKPAIANAHRMLKQVNAHILGGVLNMVPPRGSDSGSYGYYGTKYGYGDEPTKSQKRRARSRKRSNHRRSS